MKILVVEDDVGIGRVVCNGLQAHGFDVEWLREGSTAIARLRSQSHGVLILDLMLPDRDGFELCRELRRSGIDIPILMLTARDSLEDKLDGFRAGTNDYLTKPFSIDELIARIRVLSKQFTKPDQETRTSYRTLEIDLLSHNVRNGDTKVDLTRREFDVLVCLVRNAGHVVTRERLLQSAWGPDADVTSNAVDVYISYLRRKLKATGDQPNIDTVRGIGFRLT